MKLLRGLLVSKIRIKFCGFTRWQDVDAAVQAGADALGFVLYEKSPRAVTLAQAADLSRRLPPFVTPVLLFVNASLDFLEACRAAIPQACWQFHGDESPALCAQATQQGKQPYIRVAHMPLLHDAGHARNQTPFDLLQFAAAYPDAQALLLDAQVATYGGSGKCFDWAQLPQHIPKPTILSGGLSVANVAEGVRMLRARCHSIAVDVSSGIEIEKGIKDAAKMHAFAAAVRAADGV